VTSLKDEEGFFLQIRRHTDATVVEALAGVFRRTMTESPSMMLCEVTIKLGSGVPLHQHPHEQIGYVVSGKIRMEIGDQEVIFEPGDSYAIPGGTPHSGFAVDGDCVVVDIFNPAREDYR
jgi:quercetin dioxygenase-like cupin family protein